MTIEFQDNGQEVTFIQCDRTGLITHSNAMQSTFIGSIIDNKKINIGYPIYMRIAGEGSYRKMNLLIEKITV